MPHPKEEKTVVLVKPDGVKRGLVGEVIRRIEQRGLKIIALRMVTPTKEQAHDHYPNTEIWMRGMGEKTLENYRTYGKDPIKEIGTNDPLEIGKMAAQWNIEFLMSGPVVAMIVEGIHAIAMVRKIVGSTLPSKADMGTIRGDYSVDSPTLANADKRAIHNVVHASGDESEAEHELKHWFSKEEVHSYKRAEEDIMF
ncbi:nucleoside-diphosphate kinase [Candidatus Uhrbacteria bacterium RIFCSPHIGHO2_02_FULL_47_29]|uniref:nucleoside-diphosphate kinase n=1 Tax=Candidatus Uhrbacteria bacterium RIFCSPLOWO2_01_FULL_47_25 TaxID=1802402 RepID=A0A1F7UU57_9BACT|nr:MAG: Nucleoside diphosphate kinase [Parcubacteria group bacterium GW2011_GWA2_46_9]OGL60868.1 MAG: nucleoside-diphosphate kinase [Candidatus Uhrbacteria bacterium RIFCSPHIGHO2_01_FULL_46_23]OGL69913.1 MAG: nucleoside-diphosphate kinase [Candidatus Uhrbacteria bacterium RIFCSPHIGHO2_02_FULL_47_29]OGL81238.1 MAG: nucleoside-diphosphate kinase [Candidatus Uhrbacteria bacterium RIFCSPLOWO2_01_FULL_47_25]OGL86015.1 MAG: nucleoside-diphosphate kinase [Candidatus Uhrbacteria bacterium RIFCSPLOWO2_0